MEVALAGSIGMPGVDECGYDTKDVGWNSKQKGLDVRVAQCADDSREEIGHGS